MAERVLERIEREASPLKLVDSVIKSLRVEEKGGTEGVSGKPANMIMGGESEVLRVLREIDQNVSLPKGQSQGKPSKGGTWKRRVTAMETTNQSGQGRDTECVAQCLGKNDKRNFCLVAEEETDCESGQKGKRSKAGLEHQLSCEEMVGVASHKWPQKDQ